MSSNNPAPVIKIDDVSVDHSKTTVYTAPKKKTFVPPWAQQQLKSSNGGNTRTFMGGTTITTNGKGPSITIGGPKFPPKTSGPTISIGKATGSIAPKRIPQPHDKVNLAPAPVAYVPEQRLYKKKLGDKAYIQKQEDKQAEEEMEQNTPESMDVSAVKDGAAEVNPGEIPEPKQAATEEELPVPTQVEGPTPEKTEGAPAVETKVPTAAKPEGAGEDWWNTEAEEGLAAMVEGLDINNPEVATPPTPAKTEATVQAVEVPPPEAPDSASC